MHWWDYMVVVAVLLMGISAFVALCVYMERVLSHGDSHEADTMYGNYADSLRKQRRYCVRLPLSWRPFGSVLMIDGLAADLSSGIHRVLVLDRPDDLGHGHAQLG